MFVLDVAEALEYADVCVHHNKLSRLFFLKQYSFMPQAVSAAALLLAIFVARRTCDAIRVQASLTLEDGVKAIGGKSRGLRHA